MVEPGGRRTEMPLPVGTVVAFAPVGVFAVLLALGGLCSTQPGSLGRICGSGSRPLPTTGFCYSIKFVTKCQTICSIYSVFGYSWYSPFPARVFLSIAATFPSLLSLA